MILLCRIYYIRYICFVLYRIIAILRFFVNLYSPISHHNTVLEKESGLAGFSAAGGSFSRQIPIPPACDPARRAFCHIGKSGALSYDRTKSGRSHPFHPRDNTCRFPIAHPYIIYFRFVSHRKSLVINGSYMPPPVPRRR